MKNIAPIGKKNFVGKKFRSARSNELSASDKNFIKNNINKLINQQLALRVGKSVEVVEKFIKKEKLIRVVEAPLIQNDTKSTSKERKTSNIAFKKIDFIKKNHQEFTAPELAIKLNCSIQTIRYHLGKLKLSSLRPTRSILESEDVLAKINFIKENHQKFTIIELAEKLNTTTLSIGYYLRKLGLAAIRKSKSKDETPEIIQFLKQNYRTTTAREMSKTLNISWSSVRYLCEKHRFLRTPKEVKALKLQCGKIIFTPTEEKYILENHGEISFGEIAKNIKRTRSSVINFLGRKGLKITKEQQSKLIKRNFELARMKAKENI